MQRTILPGALYCESLQSTFESSLEYDLFDLPIMTALINKSRLTFARKRSNQRFAASCNKEERGIMLTKSNKNRLQVLGITTMCALAVLVSLGVCGSLSNHSEASAAESQKEVAVSEEKSDESQKPANTNTAKAKEATSDKKDAKTSGSKAAKTAEVTTDKSTAKKSDNADKKTPKANASSDTQTAWGEGLDCAACHTKVADTLNNDKCLASKHTAVECTTCHADATLADTHATVSADDRMPSSLRASAVDTALCEGCHEPETLAEKTVDCTVLTDDNGTMVNPHELPDVAEHAEVTCVSCHKMHSKTGVEKSASRACQSCHHTNVYECGTCHAA